METNQCVGRVDFYTGCNQRSTHRRRQGQLGERWIKLPSDEQEAPIPANVVLRDIIPRRDARVLPYPRCYFRRYFLKADAVCILLRE